MPRIAIIPLLVTSFILLSMFPCSAAEPQTQPDLPAPIADLKAKIQGKKSAEVMTIIQAQFGAPARSIGSGLYIPQWDVAGGVLTFHPFRGPTFSRGASRVMLIDTHNKVGQNIPGDYEMSTLADPNNHGNRFWIGNVILQPDGKYLFRPGGAGLTKGAKDAANFFISHPGGVYAIHYAKGVNAESVMEDLADKSVIATLEFTADPADKPPGATHRIDLRIEVTRRSLYFAPAAEPPLTYLLAKSWEKFWN